MYRKVSQTHGEVVLRPPPGTRFTIFGSDVHLQFQLGKEAEIVQWLRNWIDSYVEPYIGTANAKYTVTSVESNVPPITVEQSPVKLNPIPCICGTTNNVHSDICDKMQAAHKMAQATAPTLPTLPAQPITTEPPKPKLSRESLKEIVNREFAKLSALASQSTENKKEESE